MPFQNTKSLILPRFDKGRKAASSKGHPSRSWRMLVESERKEDDDNQDDVPFHRPGILLPPGLQDNHELFTYEEKFDAELLEESSQAGDFEDPADMYVDELQALNTALCFLCSINADSAEVERFLKLHPESLLLEGACLLPEDSAKYILEQHARRCTCDGQCHSNRSRVLELVTSGFETFRSSRERREGNDAKLWNAYFLKLVEYEHTIRKIRREELIMRNTLIETGVDVRTYQEELNEIYRFLDTLPSAAKQSPLAMLACRRPSPSSGNAGLDSAEIAMVVGRRSVLEYQVGVAKVTLDTVKREHKNLLQSIRDSRRAQFKILKRAFKGCMRHDICSVGYVASSDTASSASAVLTSVSGSSAAPTH